MDARGVLITTVGHSPEQVILRPVAGIRDAGDGAKGQWQGAGEDGDGAA